MGFADEVTLGRLMGSASPQATQDTSPASAWGTRAGRATCGDLDRNPASLPLGLVALVDCRAVKVHAVSTVVSYH
jgi:hypothetical protein